MIHAIIPEHLEKYSTDRKNAQDMALALVDLTDGDISAASLVVSHVRESFANHVDSRRIAHIKISGVLQKEHDFWSMLFGGSTIYSDIQHRSGFCKFRRVSF